MSSRRRRLTHIPSVQHDLDGAKDVRLTVLLLERGWCCDVASIEQSRSHPKLSDGSVARSFVIITVSKNMALNTALKNPT